MAVVAALAAAGCAATVLFGRLPVKDGGIFRWLGTDSSIDSLNPFVAFQADAYTTVEYIYPSLVQYNPKLQIVPDFATSWQMSDGGRVWTFHTAPNADWSDGKPLTAQDAAWTFSTILKYQNTATANSAGYVAHMASAAAPNATTLVLTYKQPVANVLSQVQQVAIVPQHVWAKYATGAGKGLTTFANNAPIVSGGPFILRKYTAKQSALFVRNPTYYKDRNPARRRDRAGVLHQRRRDGYCAEERPAGRRRVGADDFSVTAQESRFRGQRDTWRRVR